MRVHPDDVATLPDLSGALAGGSVTVVADPTVEPGGCLAEAGDRTVDARLSTALERLREVLARERPPGPGPHRDGHACGG